MKLQSATARLGAASSSRDRHSWRVDNEPSSTRRRNRSIRLAVSLVSLFCLSLAGSTIGQSRETITYTDPHGRQHLLEELREINDRIEQLWGEKGLPAKAHFEARAALKRAIEIAEAFPDNPEAARSYFYLGRLGSLLDLQQDTQALAVAIYCHRKALEIQRRTPEALSLRTAEILNSLGYLLRLQGNLKEASECFVNAVGIRKELLSEDDPELAQSLGNLGITLFDLGRLQEAQPYLERALEIRVKKLGLEDPDTVTSLEAVGALHRELRDPKTAQSYYEQALEINVKLFGSAHPRVALSLGLLGNLLADIGNFAEAREHLERALAINEAALGPKHPETAISLNNLGTLLQQSYRWKEARSILERALLVHEEGMGVEHPNTIKMLNNLGTLLSTAGDEKGARAYYDRALEVAERVFGRVHPITLTCLHNAGRLQEAFEVAGQLFGPEHPATENLLLKALAVSARRGLMNGSAQAATMLQELLESQQRRYGEDHLLTADTHHYLALALHMMMAIPRETVEGHYSRALEIHEREFGKDHPRLIATLRDYGQYLLFIQDDRRAVEILERSLSLSEQMIGVGNPQTIEVIDRISYLYARMREVERLFHFLGKKLQAEERWLESVLLVGSSEEKSARVRSVLGLDGNLDYVSYHLALAPRDQQAARLALTAILRRKARGLDVYSQELQLFRAHLEPEGRRLLARLQESREAKTVLMLREPDSPPADLMALEGRIQELERELARRVETLPRALTHVDLDAVRQRIPARAALVEFFTCIPFENGSWIRNAERRSAQLLGREGSGDDTYVAYVVSRSGEIRWVDLGRVPVINRAARALRDAISNRRTDVMSRARELDQLTMAKIRPLLGSAKDLIISPDAELNLVSFAALVDEEDRFLIERYGLSYVTSGRDLLSSKAARTDGEPPLLLGDPDFDSFIRAKSSRSLDATEWSIHPVDWHFDRLPGTAAEVEAIGHALDLPADRVVTGQAATETTLKGVRGPRVLHLATHGFFRLEYPAPETHSRAQSVSRPEDPLIHSGLVLAGANRYREAANAQDGILTALEVMGLDLWGTEIAVLSACVTGVGEVSYGEGVLGLRRALALAGARTQVLSLWKVADEATKDLMISFYQQLVRGVGRAKAMQQIQLTAMRGAPLPETDRPLSRGGRGVVGIFEETQAPGLGGSRHPYFWASFIVSGDTGPLPEVTTGGRHEEN